MGLWFVVCSTRGLIGCGLWRMIYLGKYKMTVRRPRRRSKTICMVFFGTMAFEDVAQHLNNRVIPSFKIGWLFSLILRMVAAPQLPAKDHHVTSIR